MSPGAEVDAFQNDAGASRDGVIGDAD